MDVHSPAVAFEVGWHLRVPIAVSDMLNLGFAGIYCSGKLVDAASGLTEALVSEGGASSYCRDEAVCDGVCYVGKVAVLHVEEGLS